MLSTLAQRTWSQGCFRERDRILLAVSGGADSMALLEIMRELADNQRIALHVAHIDHGLRGHESIRDREFVRRYARFVGLPATIKHVNVDRRRARSGGSLEEVARLERYAALEDIRKRQGMRVIATAHHADDQIETVLMRAMRGTDVKGLAGILPALSDPPVIRPLLPVRRTELLSYVSENRIPFREDSTNTDTRHTRNRIRHRVIPELLRRGDQEFLDALPLLADLARRLSDQLSENIPLHLEDQTDVRHGSIHVNIDALRSLPGGVLSTYIGTLLTHAGISLSADRIGRVRRLLGQSPGKRILFHGARAEVLRDRDTLVFGPLRPGSVSSVRLRPGSSARIAGSTVSADSPGPSPRSFPSGRMDIWVDAASIRGGMTIRPWRAGDRMLPLGMGGKSKKVSDILRDAHVPLYYKARIPVVTSKGKIVWICGIRQDERFKLTPSSVSAVKLSYHPHV